jgi:hypothetical protein
MARSLRLYLPALLREWWALVGLASGVIGYVAAVVAKLSVPVAIWVSLFVACLVLAQFRVYHKLRVAAMPNAMVPLPQWAGFATHANSEGAWLSAVISGRPVAGGWVSTAYTHMRALIEDHFGIPAGEMGGRSYSSGADFKWPPADFTPLFHCQVGVNGLGAVVIQWRNIEDAIPLRWLVSNVLTALGFVVEGGIDSVIRRGKDRVCVLALGNWPAGGIVTEDVVSAKRTEQFVQGYKVTRQYKIRPNFDTWEVARDFVEAVLGDGGYVGFEEQLKLLAPENFPRLQVLREGGTGPTGGEASEEAGAQVVAGLATETGSIEGPDG